MDWFLQKWAAYGFDSELGLALRLGASLVVGGVMGIFVRFLFNRCSSTVSNAETISGIFPLLIMVTVAVIAVVKSSLALSLGLVGALSIVRFRAAIKDPEELTYLFLCIALGLALGAWHFLYAAVLLVVASGFVLGRRFLGPGVRRKSLLLTVTGETGQCFEVENGGALAAVEELAERYTIQRYEIDGAQGVLRVVVDRLTTAETASIIRGLRERVPAGHISYVNMDTIL